MFIFSFKFRRLILLNDILVQWCVLIFLDSNIFALTDIPSCRLFMWGWNTYFYFIWVGASVEIVSFFVCLIYRYRGICSWAASYNFSHYFLSKLLLWHLLNLPWWVSLFYAFNNRLHLFRWKGWSRWFTRLTHPLQIGIGSAYWSHFSFRSCCRRPQGAWFASFGTF